MGRKAFVWMISSAFLLGAMAANGWAETRWTVYYSDRAPLAEFDKFSLVVFDSDHHPALPPLARQDKTLLGYLSVGEVEQNRAYFPAVRGEGILLNENPNWKGSYFVDVRDPRWQQRVLDQLIPRILQQGFAGVFLDTLDNPLHLERTEPAKYRGTTSAAIQLVKTMRRASANHSTGVGIYDVVTMQQARRG